MSANSICQQLATIDFASSADLRRILCQDKHTRIEGLCSEIAFAKDVLLNNLDPTTGNFWFNNHYRAYAVTRILSTPHCTFTDLDYRILDGFATIGNTVPVRVVYFNLQAREFRELRHNVGARYPADLSGAGSLLPQARSQGMAGAGDRDEVRLNKACDYIEEHGNLYEMAVHRLFANCWMGSGAVLDVDGFTQTTKGKVVALEVKQKYPTPKRTFGLNSGQAGLFRFLSANGMPVVHVILEKPTQDKHIHAVDLLRLEQYTKVTRWIYTRFQPEKYEKAHTPAPASTSIYGNRETSYEHIPCNLFNELKMFGVPAADVRSKLLAGLE